MADTGLALRDIHLPDAVGIWPPAPGWWLLTLLALAIGAWLAQRGYRHWRDNSYRRHALAALHALQARRGDIDNRQYLAELNALLKRAAISRDPACRPLSGQPWLQYLDQHWPRGHFDQDSALLLAQGHYRAEPPSPEQLAALHSLAAQWLKEHRVRC